MAGERLSLYGVILTSKWP